MSNENDKFIADLKVEYEKGWEDAVKKLQDILNIWGEAACVLLDFMPSKELTLPWRVSDECVLEFTVRKK